MIPQKDKLVEICKAHILSKDSEVVIREPYVPFIPEGWNGVLVLAEAQNLSKTNSKYVSCLHDLDPLERFFRLSDPNNLGIQPWDDGSLKLAVQSAFNIDINKTAVSNSIVWSQVKQNGNNDNPSNELMKLASSFWNDLLSVITPSIIVTSGKKASTVINGIKTKQWKHIQLRLPSPMAMSRVSGMFPEKELLSRYPEVEESLNKNPEWLNGGYRQNKVFFACHAVTVAKTNKA